MNQRRVFGVLTLTAMLTTGCGSESASPQKFPVVGLITLNGEPLPEGDVIFRSADGGHSYAGKVVDGTCMCDVEAGNKQIEIRSYKEIPGKTREDNPGEIVAVREQVVPEKYNSRTTLTAIVETDIENTFVFELEGDPPKTSANPRS